MIVRLKPTTVSGMLVCQQLEVEDSILYTLPHHRGFETDFITALEAWISEAGIHYWSYKNNVKGRRDAAERWNTLKAAKETVIQMGNYKNVAGKICSDRRP